MKKSIGKKIILSYFLILVISFTLVGIMFYFIMLNYIERGVANQLIIQGREAAALINKSFENRDVFKERTFLRIVRDTFWGRKMQVSGQDYAILDPRGNVLFTNVKSLKGKNIDINNFKRIRRGYYSRKGDKISVILPLDRGYLMLSGRLKGIKIMTLEILRILLLTFLISGIIVINIGMFLSRSITAPIKKMAITASRLKERDFDVDIDINTGDELQELGDTINDMARKLKDYDLAQKRFFQNVSHELKTPLMSIQGYAEGIKDGVFKEDGIEVILNETARMRKLVNDIIYLSKLETVNDFFNFAETDINEVIRKSVEKFEGVARLRNIEIEMKIDGPGKIRADEEKLLQAVANLLSNAVKHARSKIRVSKEVKDSWVVIEVADDGEGIDSKDIDKVFERFYKGKNGDTGIGLSIVKTIVEKHGGKVKAYNSKNKGAVFRIEIPQNFHI